jgi:hypothetical protein
LKNFINIIITHDIRSPRTNDTATSKTGAIADTTEKPLPLSIDFTIEVAKPKAISAVASSIATTLISMDVIGPFALYCLTTMIVCAGAVAAEIALRSIDNGSENPRSIHVTRTNATAPKLSKHAMTIGAAPTFLKYDNLNSLPIAKAIKPSAISDAIPKLETISAVIILKQQGPRRRPAIR